MSTSERSSADPRACRGRRLVIAGVALAVSFPSLVAAAPAMADPQDLVPVNVSAAALAELPDSAQSHARVVAVGRTVDFVDHGQGVQVFASAMPREGFLDRMKPGDTFNKLPLARGKADGSGAFTLRADTDSIPAEFRGPNGQVDLEIVVWDGQRAGQAMISSFSSPGSDQARGSATVKADEKEVTQPGKGFGKSWLSCTTTLLSRGYLRKADIGDSMTPDWKQTAWMTYSSSQSVSLGTAIDVSSDSVGWKAGGTVSRSSTFTASWDPSAANRSYTLESELGYYKDVCYTVMTGSSSYAYTKWSYIPIKLTGGYSTAVTSSFTANYCTGALAAGTWTRNLSTGHAWTLSSGFDISGLVGFDVSSTSNWDTSNALNYRQPTSGLYKLCGNNDYPANASRVVGRYA